MTDEERWALIWLAWVAGFAVAEYIALRSGQHATASHQTRRIFGARHPSTLRRRAGQIAFGAAVAWTTHHLWKAA